MILPLAERPKRPIKINFTCYVKKKYEARKSDDVLWI